MDDEHELKNLLAGGNSATIPSESSPLPANDVVKHRAGYARVPSVSFNDHITIQNASGDVVSHEPAFEESSESNFGLGITSTTSASSPTKPEQVSQPQRPSPTSPRGSYTKATPLISSMASPRSLSRLSGSTRFGEALDDFDTSYAGPKSCAAKVSTTSLHSTNAPSIYAQSDTVLLNVQARYDEFAANRQKHGPVQVKRPLGGFVSVVILTLAVFSSVFSGIFLIIALMAPHWGRRISNDNGMLTPAAAATLTSFFAKLIEMSFVTVVVAFVGQALARRAFKLEDARGVTLAEISMRTWIMQPGSLLTQWASVKYAGFTFLGLLSLLAAVLAIAYTSAATTLVQPQLKYSGWSSSTLQGLVRSQFANPSYIGQSCNTPITPNYDGEYYSTTCLQIEHSAMAYHNYYTWLSTWTRLVHAGVMGDDLSSRPKGFALLNDNTTIDAPWIEQQPVQIHNETRFISNVTMAMPHVGVIQAAMDPINALMQPAEADGAQYQIRASVPSAFVNVLCATVLEEDLRPFVYSLWPGMPSLTPTQWITGQFSYPKNTTAYLNGTSLDEIFKFGAQYGSYNYPPVFYKLPQDYNTLINTTNSWGRTSIYMLGKGGPTDYFGSPVSQYYQLCQMQVGTTPNCSTRYNASSTGATLEAVCEDPHDELAYIKSVTNATQGSATLSPDWPNLASEWSKSISLNSGILDANASNSRMLMQFMVTGPKYSTALPSTAEALAVLSGCTLIQALMDSPFVQHWGYTLSTVESGAHQAFNATMRTLQFSSGGVLDHQKAFHIVLFAVFIINVLILVYFLLHRHWYTDFGEPINLFSLAVNSPPSHHVAAHAGSGSKGDHYRVHWKLNREDGHYVMESHNPSDSEPARRWTMGMTPLFGASSPMRKRFTMPSR